MIDHSTMRLGKRPRRHDPRTLKLGRYVKSTLAPAPPCVDYTRGITNWGMMLNDRLGDCIIADGPGHATQVWTLNATGTMMTPADPLILETYEKWCGYNPADPNTDQGGVELDVLNHWRQQGFADQPLDAYGAIELAQGPHPTIPMLEVMDAIWLFGGAYIGVELPISAQTQDVWDVPANPGPDDEPGSWGGHAVYLVGYDSAVADTGFQIPNSGSPNPGSANPESPNPEPQVASPVSRVPCPGSLTCITWGQLKKMTWQWFAKYCSEAYGLVAKEWLEASGVSPSGFDLAALENDLKLVTA